MKRRIFIRNMSMLTGGLLTACHVPAETFEAGKKVKLHETRKGDILIFTGTNPSDRTPGHVGIVISQAVMMSPATLHRTLLTRSAEPTPTIAELTTCEMLTGTPYSEAVSITMPEVNCVEKLCRGRIL